MSKIKKSEPLHNQVYHIVKRMLIEGEYQPGDRLVEVKLAESLGVSRAPVREAIRMLIQDGLLEQKEGLVYLINPTTQTIVEVFQCRQSLESLSARLAAKNISDSQLQQLAQNIQETQRAIQQNDSKEIGRLDQQFHDLIIEASGNQQLISLMSIIQAKISYIRNSIIRNFYQNFLTFADEHQRIYQALLERDENKAEMEMRSHIEKNLSVSYTLIQ
ncbi:GntR family transcriptional regulator [Ammoniphilus sp. YIM 78166]|uniref:GntR family transcriptional regulator n=1 Tax=Ammoniphilus sp. YIM 78166 TaxID=1644106 RepID=UPI0014320CE5|nr:GntR family transcriptional regulator [Ammoniphilus sp. YIM 78166]